MLKLFDYQVLTYFRTMMNIAKNTTILITKTCLPKRYFTVFLLPYMLCKHRTFYFLVLYTYYQYLYRRFSRNDGSNRRRIDSRSNWHENKYSTLCWFITRISKSNHIKTATLCQQSNHGHELLYGRTTLWNWSRRLWLW